MFAQIRNKLVFLNALVFFVILIAGSTMLYLYMEERLLDQVDAAMVDQSQRMFNGDQGPMFRPVGRQLDRQAVLLAWTTEGKLINTNPSQEEMEEADVLEFQKIAPHDLPQTYRFGAHSYRVLTIGTPGNTLIELKGNLFKVSLAKVQLVRNIDSEQAILNRLLTVLSAGTLFGGIVTILAGLFLAGRALVPIRISWEKQQQFVADASHELRTPLAVIQSQTELLFRHPERTIQEESEKIAGVYKEARRMNKLVSDLLTLARSDSNQLEIERKLLPLDALLAEISWQFAQMAELREIKLTTKLQPGIRIEADEARLRQLLVILLDNALKYTGTGGKVHVACNRSAHGAEIVVEDNGAGIAREDLPFVFDRFYRGDKVRTSSDGGTGLGLSIAKWIVEAHHGKIRVDSTPGEGTAFTVSLPTKK
ncbi:signal transduction histidine kinase [Tumebacillus sp. BK434]|uniref:sensor histidine kinase n=1 Tax=Tumebacillus sp. BK434 TaxID=2512169 RepID=UPI001047B30D|nr:HAMP domain-containing sensor histidine kinase [Tumebacillus sp. BK434]TCP53687.1 signal transduction histidine kinase [Tumebacillus sp. BK434]